VVGGWVGGWVVVLIAMPRADLFFQKNRSESDADSEDNGEPDDPVNQDDGGEAQEEVEGAPMEADNHTTWGPT